MIVVIDNYDSFTYNLVQLVEDLGETCYVIRNDQATVEEIRKLNPDFILISPGPGIPEDAGISLEVIKQLGTEVPTLGVCLGHQAIAKAFGGEIKLAERLMHGKTSTISHNHQKIFTQVPELFEAGRYHSWVVDRESLPEEIEVTAVTEEGEIMAIRHKEYPIEGVQFHPESILTPYGRQILQNFIQYYKGEHKASNKKGKRYA
ncbi:aminodeoxychorismate/anthranilate synthase component II [Tepidibacillus infernus]|uniref:Anthranilate synthase n=1 Tax=Tepidibacillus decaturensis TaxID=1413211 RepID=A0A135L4Q8_9BACI|nr:MULTISPECIES: aminodeoxychorismate/anthranilate synthase component II [Tepidibacillus]KXG43994.1 anthranilate synthase [Tepidibacillus decaturensis]GBF10377.1 aminodeoxychorismate/anthranilate synthase component 2 [Tepidibacillus sp. HK-1]